MQLIITILEIAGLALAGALTGYLALLSIVALFTGRRNFRDQENGTRFAIIVPAHNEELSIEKTIRSLKTIDYPGTLYDVFVVADNCNDRTAAVAAAAGAGVMERTDADRRGKGHALRWAFDTLLSGHPGYDAFVVIDADSVATPNYLRVMRAYLSSGARVIQSGDLVAENRESWSTEVTRLGFTLYNHVRPLGRSALGFSVGLRGNGMCFSAEILREIPWNAYGVTEDLQYGLTLLLRGVKVEFAPEAVVYATMPERAVNAVSQRIRWEQGRSPVRSLFSRRLLSRAVRGPSVAALDAWIDLITPPFVHLMGMIGASVVLHGILGIVLPEIFAMFFVPWAIIFLLGITHVFTGLVAVRADRRQYAALFHVPRFALWKLRLRLARSDSSPPKEWVRTTRERTAPEAMAGDDKSIVSPE